jgi:hypothetical protein
MERPYGISDFAFPTQWGRESGPDLVERAGRGSRTDREQDQSGREKGSNASRSRGFDRPVTIYRGREATMVEPGVYEQKNAGHLVIGELAGGVSERIDRVARTFGPAIEVKASSNITGAIWSKLLINFSVTTLGALCSQTMRQY